MFEPFQGLRSKPTQRLVIFLRICSGIFLRGDFLGNDVFDVFFPPGMVFGISSICFYDFLRFSKKPIERAFVFWRWVWR